jgi:hypothetical protein
MLRLWLASRQVTQRAEVALQCDVTARDTTTALARLLSNADLYDPTVGHGQVIRGGKFK